MRTMGGGELRSRLLLPPRSEVRVLLSVYVFAVATRRHTIGHRLIRSFPKGGTRGITCRIAREEPLAAHFPRRRRSDVSLTDYFVLVPVANLISAVPLAPGGWGVGELAFQGLFRMIHASPAMGVAVSVTFRLSQLAIGLLGGVFLLLPRSRSELRKARED